MRGENLPAANKLLHSVGAAGIRWVSVLWGRNPFAQLKGHLMLILLLAKGLFIAAETEPWLFAQSVEVFNVMRTLR